MKKYLAVLFLFLALASCDDGDIIVTNFDFDSDSNLELCKVGSSNIMYIVNTDPDESISFNFSDKDFDGTYEEDIESKTKTVNLNSSNKLIYRSYDSSLEGNSYFCSGVPPKDPKITQEYQSKNGGTIDITTTLINQEIDTTASTLIKTYKTYAVAHNVTLKKADGKEEIVKEILRLGSLKRTATFDILIDSL